MKGRDFKQTFRQAAPCYRFGSTAQQSILFADGDQHAQLAIVLLIGVIGVSFYPVVLAAGVVFSKNPSTGLDEVIVETVQGLGTQLVSRGKTSDTWVYKWGRWTEEPAEREADLTLIEQVVRGPKKPSAVMAARSIWNGYMTVRRSTGYNYEIGTNKGQIESVRHSRSKRDNRARANALSQPLSLLNTDYY